MKPNSKMMKSLLICTMTFMVLVKIQAQTPNCSQFHDGTFILEDSVSGITHIERIGNVQIEENEKMGSRSKLQVEWLDDCTYTLQLMSREADEGMHGLEELILTVKIIETKDNSYIQQTSANLSPMILEGEIFKFTD